MQIFTQILKKSHRRVVDVEWAIRSLVLPLYFISFVMNFVSCVIFHLEKQDHPNLYIIMMLLCVMNKCVELTSKKTSVLNLNSWFHELCHNLVLFTSSLLNTILIINVLIRFNSFWLCLATLHVCRCHPRHTISLFFWLLCSCFTWSGVLLMMQ